MTSNTIRVFIYPEATGVDLGEGGVGRIVRIQQEFIGMPHSSGVKFERATSIEDADVIACHIHCPEEFTRRRPNIPIAAHIHGMYWSEYDWPKGFLSVNGEVAELVRIADSVTSPSEWVSRVIQQQFSRPSRTVYHAVNMEFWNSIEREETGPYVFFDKTRRDAVCETDSLRELAKLLPGVQFVTTAPVEDAPENVRYIGRVAFAVAAQLMKNAAAYLATTRETFGVSNLQALACGVPIVGYDWGGQREISWEACDEESLFVNLVEPSNVAALAKELQEVLDAGITDDARALARNLCERFSLEAAMASYQDSWLEAYQAHAREREDAPAVSVIITAYKLAEYLPAAIESALAQDDVEVIVVDDNSPDDCGAIADSYAARDGRVRVVHNERNLYLAGARNAGVALARGRYIIPLDADDQLAPYSLRELAQALDANRHYDIAYGNVFFKEADGTLWHSQWPIQWTAELQTDGKNCLPYASMYRRRVFDTIGGYRTRCHTAEDADFWLRATLAGFRARYATKNDVLIYLNRADSMSHTIRTPNWAAWSPRQLPAGTATEEVLPIPALDPPVIAVIIPVGPGHQKYLLDALDSVHAQSYVDWECIVVDDTNGEGLGYVPPWVRVVQSHKRGVAAARNAGIRASRARLFLPLDADDYLQPNALEDMYAAYHSSGRQSIIYSDFWEDPEIENQFSIFRTLDHDCRLYVSKGMYHTVTALTPKRYWQAVAGYDEDLSAWEDWAFALKCASKGFPSRRIALPLFTYRKKTGTRRNENYDNYEQSKAAFLERFDFWKDGSMACACNKGATATIADSSFANVVGAVPTQNADAMLVEYVGPSVGNFSVRGPSGTSYRFARNGNRFVLNQDVQSIVALKDFRLAAPPPTPLDESAPLLSVLVESARR